MFDQTNILLCCHCGNRTPHSREFNYSHQMFFDEFEEGVKVYEPYEWHAYSCHTCGALTLYGKFEMENREDLSVYRLHPKGSNLIPPSHTISPGQPIPKEIITIYDEVWPLRHRSPSAFIGQIRRLLEFICKDKNANGRDLFAKLKDLVTKGVFPGYFTNITDLLRKVGNMGAHAVEADLSTWDAELIDEFFRSVIDYVYIAPARIKRMEQRLHMNKPNETEDSNSE